jgi:hypothetical protein
MPKGIMKLETGGSVTVEGNQEEVTDILRTLMNASRVTTVRKPTTAEPPEAVKREGAPELVLELKKDNFFEKPKGLGDISAALEEKGFLYPVTSLSGVMLSLVKKRFLRRKKVDGKWVYGK